jgi:hypothetical protein
VALELKQAALAAAPAHLQLHAAEAAADAAPMLALGVGA